MNKRDFIKALGTAAIAAPVAAVTAHQFTSQSGSPEKESVYARVQRTCKMRCGYLTYLDWFAKDPSSGNFSGLCYDLMQEFGRLTELEIEITEEVGWGNILEGVATNRFETVILPLWENVPRTKAADFTSGLFYNGVVGMVRFNETRFENGIEAVNHPDVRIVTVDGEMGEQIARTDFPKAKLISMPQTTPMAELLLNVQHGKADVVFQTPDMLGEYTLHNPGKLKALRREPLRVFKTAFPVKKNQPEFLNFCNAAIAQMHNSGFMDQLLAKYEKHPGTFYRIAKPYLAA